MFVIVSPEKTIAPTPVNAAMIHLTMSRRSLSADAYAPDAAIRVLSPPPKQRHNRSVVPPIHRTTGTQALSASERDLLALVGQGTTDAEIAEQLFISIRTLRTLLDRIRDKSGCRRRADLTRLALHAGII